MINTTETIFIHLSTIETNENQKKRKREYVNLKGCSAIVGTHTSVGWKRNWTSEKGK